MRNAALLLVTGFCLLVGALVFVWPDLQLWLASDSCMGNGGSFDFVSVRCDFQQAHPYVTFSLFPFWAAGVTACLGLGLVGRGLLGLRPNNSSKPTPLRSRA